MLELIQQSRAILDSILLKNSDQLERIKYLENLLNETLIVDNVVKPAPPEIIHNFTVDSWDDLKAKLTNKASYDLQGKILTFSDPKGIELKSDILIKNGVIEYTGLEDGIAFEIPYSRVNIDNINFVGQKLNAIYAIRDKDYKTCSDVTISNCSGRMDQFVKMAGGCNRWNIIGNNVETISYAHYQGNYKNPNTDINVEENKYVGINNKSHVMRCYGCNKLRVYNNLLDGTTQRSAVSFRGGQYVDFVRNRVIGPVYIGPENADKEPAFILDVKCRFNKIFIPFYNANFEQSPGFTLENGGEFQILFNEIFSDAKSYLFRQDGISTRPLPKGLIAYNVLKARMGVPILNKDIPEIVIQNNVMA